MGLAGVPGIRSQVVVSHRFTRPQSIVYELTGSAESMVLTSLPCMALMFFALIDTNDKGT